MNARQDLRRYKELRDLIDQAMSETTISKYQTEMKDLRERLVLQPNLNYSDFGKGYDHEALKNKIKGVNT